VKITMSDDVSDIAAYYDNLLENEHSRLERHQLEWDLTWRYLNQYLPSQASILEVGAGPGRYTLELAKQGYMVTAVDLSVALLEECKKSIAGKGLEGKCDLLWLTRAISVKWMRRDLMLFFL
jgi:2-polyprenyl-3-methyl-5-hydroxy-6-metoxy-1,4-benzoquinol methylase